MSSKIDSSISLGNSTEGIAFYKGLSLTANEANSSLKLVALTTADTLVDVDSTVTAGQIALSHEGDEGDAGLILVGFDGTLYDQSLGPGEFVLIRLRNEDKLETQTITTVADVSANLDATYVTLEGNSGTWAIWIDADDSGTAAPAHGKDSAVEITGIVTDDTAAAVALAIYTELVADTAFAADFDVSYDAAVDDDFITITDKFTGTRTDLADTGTTGFTVATTQAGAASRAVHIKSSTGIIDTMVAVMPN